MLTPQVPALGRGAFVDPPLETPTPFTSLRGERSTDTSVTIGLKVARTNPAHPTFDLRGRSIDRHEVGAYKVDTRVSQIPCPGEYRFEAATEDSSNGNSSSYSALLRLSDPVTHPSGARCGGAPPPLRGQMSILLQNRVERLFLAKGTRSNGGAFGGKLFLSSLPECDKTYVLEAALDLDDWSRSAEFKAQAVKIDTTLQGRPAESKRC
jgi:hypothetical protein